MSEKVKISVTSFMNGPLTEIKLNYFLFPYLRRGRSVTFRFDMSSPKSAKNRIQIKRVPTPKRLSKPKLVLSHDEPLKRRIKSKRFNCDKCSERFEQKFFLKRHIAETHSSKKNNSAKNNSMTTRGVAKIQASNDFSSEGSAQVI